MNTNDAIRVAAERGGVGLNELSRRVGRSGGYVTGMLSRGSVPRADTLALLARACGGRLVIRGLGDDIEVGPEGSGRSGDARA